MTELYLEKAFSEQNYENLDEAWQLPAITKFSSKKTLFFYQLAAQKYY